MKPAARRAQPRNNALAQIHIAAQALGMDTADKNPECEYRRTLFAIGRKHSAAELDHASRAKVIDHLNRLLQLRGINTGKHARKGHPGKVAFDVEALTSKVEALLADAGRPWAYANSMAKRMFKVDAVRFCDGEQLHKLVAALMYDQQREARRLRAMQDAPSRGAA